MKIKVSQLDRLLFLLSEKTKESLDRAGLRNMASQIGGISEDYLYKKLFYVIRGMNKEHSLSLRDAQLNSVARFIGFKNIRDFISASLAPADEQLRSLVGNYLAFVRQNSAQGLIFQSPVEIKESEGQFVMSLKGPSWTYQGILKIKHGCLFIHLETPENKSFYHVYKIGTSRSPKVIQGIFSGVSTAFDPIGGRAVLLKVNEHAGSLKNQAMHIRELSKSTVLEHKKLAAYFKDYAKNNLSINKIISFGMEDLEDS
ncbi:MAG: hypothetical protein ABIR06_06685 [Cyclobacteriaceae bacterium]